MDAANFMRSHTGGGPVEPTVAVVDESSKLPLFDGSGQSMNGNEQVRGNELAIEEAHERPAKDNVIVEGFGK